MKRVAWYSVLVGGVVAMATTGSTCNPPGPPSEVLCGTGRTCRSGRCAVTVPPSPVLPPGAIVKIAEEPAPVTLGPEIIQPFVCVLTLPPSVSAAVRLSMYAEGAPPTAMLFRNDPEGPVAIDSSTTTGPLVEALLTRGGVYGATLRPEDWRVESTVSNDPLTSKDTASLVRNLSLQSITAAWFDGARLYVGDGPRVLVYDGIPSSPHVKPIRVLGQPELDKIVAGTSASIFSGGVHAIWSDGAKLVVAEGNRVLVWNALPATDFAPADLVLGQQDFASSAANTGGVSATTLSSPRGIDSDGTRLLIADTMNHRVLAWSTFPTSIAEPATSVLGQGSFAGSDFGRFYQPFAAHLDGEGAFVASVFTGSAHFASLGNNALPDYAPISSVGPSRVRRDALPNASGVTPLPGGGLAIADASAGRVGIFRTKPTSPTPLDFVVGQPDPDRWVRNATSSSSLSRTTETKVFSSNGLMLVPDVSRLLVFEGAPRFNFEPAARVVGQAGFSVNDRGTDYRRIGSRTLGHPADVAALGSVVAVADRGNHRVLLYSSALPGTNAPSTVVLGQADMTSFVPNVDQVSPSATTLSGPSGVALAAAHLIVADADNHRVLVWTPVPTVSGTPATFVLGQSDFAGRRPNHGRDDADSDGYSDAAADGMFFPTGVATDGTHLFVADRLNHRVLVWSDLALVTNGKPADAVIGQSDFSSVRPNRGSAFAARLDGLNLPTGVTLNGSSLWVSDTENNRLVRWDDAFTSAVATRVIGQVDGAAISNLNYHAESSVNAGAALSQPTTSTSVLRPRGVAVLGNHLYVSETDSNRVHVFEHLGDDSYLPRGQLGQASDSLSTLNAGGIGAGSLAAPLGIAAAGSKLFVTDSGNHRVLGWEVGATLASNTPASVVIGQPSFVANGFDQALATSAGGTTRPRGLALSRGELLVAETSRHRILVHELPLFPGKQPKRIIGQPDLSVALPNVGGAPSASTLSSPRGVFADDTRVIVVDTANHRVLVYPRDGASAALVLGQATFTQNAPNAGATPGASTMNGPESVFTDGTRLFVADTGNHRVLVWNTFPTSNGEPASVVLGQAGFTGTQTNRGTGVASASSLAGPSAVHVANGALFVADSGNNRVLVYSAVLSTSGTSASSVLGQPTFESRVPTADINDATRLSGPVALASDGASLFVADRDANRVAAFTLSDVATGARASVLFNANSGLTSAGPAGLAAERGPLFSSRLYVADTNKDQLLVVGSVTRLR